MKLAIMQPYFFPYIGYWQLIRAVDRFVVFDDVAYIKRGWVNRNQLLINGTPRYFTAPVHDASQNRRICDTRLQPSAVWRDKLVKTVEMAYRKAPYFAEVFPVVTQTVRHETENLSEFLLHQLRTLARFMDIRTELVPSSRCYGNETLAGQARIIDICRQEGAHTYINAPGGRALYDTQTFCDVGINLRFISMQVLPYAQRQGEFVPNLSIVDALMAVGPAGIVEHLDAYELQEVA